MPGPEALQMLLLSRTSSAELGATLRLGLMCYDAKVVQRFLNVCRFTKSLENPSIRCVDNQKLYTNDTPRGSSWRPEPFALHEIIFPPQGKQEILCEPNTQRASRATLPGRGGGAGGTDVVRCCEERIAVLLAWALKV